MEIRKTAIVTDSGCDLSDSLLEEYDIRMIPLRIVYHDREYRDRREISPDQVYANLSVEIPKTSLPLPEDVSSVYDELVEQGYTDILHLTISSGLSGTYNMVRMLASEYENIRIQVLDTKSLSMQEGFMVLECARKLRETNDPDAALAHAASLRQKSAGMFVIRTLEYLRKGGRIGLVEGVLGTMLQLKPVIFVNDDGIYQTLVKARGYANAIESMLREIAERFGRTRVKLAVVHGSAHPEAEGLMGRLQSALNVAEAHILQVSPVLGAHTGPSLVGIIACEA